MPILNAPLPNLLDRARHKWPGILAALGIPERALSGKHGPCPMCGGKDRFRFTDHEGRGGYICNKCGPGDGPKLLMEYKGIDFKTVVREVGSVVGAVNAAPPPPKRDSRDLGRRLWQQTQPVAMHNDAGKYLHKRLGFLPVTTELGFHPRLRYFEDVFYPAMLARVIDSTGNFLNLHRTFLHNGDKAPVDPVRKMMPGPAKGCVRLAAAGEQLGIAEGIETALAASRRFGVPVWSAINAGGLEAFTPPPGVKLVHIFGDNDENAVGQAAAYKLVHRLHDMGIESKVYIPEKPGTDWADK